VKGIFESVLRWKSVNVRPTKVEICAPVQFHRYTTNYGGPLRASDAMNKGASFQFYAVVLANVRYRLYAQAEFAGHHDSTTWPPHAYQDVFNRALERGQWFYTPCLGWKEFAPDYVGPFRPETRVCETEDHELTTMLRMVFDQMQGGHHKKNFMQEPITQVGRLLALADSLHQQYCKHVRKGESPSQLIGNALFNTALDQPVFALARLAERLTPYQAWARTFQSNDPDAGVGLVKYFLSEIATCTAAIRVEDLPPKMSDADKAKLLLGYLADHPKSETPKQ
jgi:CRISPR-associated protein Cas5d